MKERLRYLLDKEQACGLDDKERWELSELWHKEYGDE